MVVTILGGSAFSTPCLVDWLARQKPAADLTLRLAGRTAPHLSAVARASTLLAAGSSIEIKTFEEARWDEALVGADVVLIQVRVGGLQAREFDEAFPLQYRVPGDEGLGPGGLSAALRNWSTVRDLLHRVRQNAPRCLPILLTSPGSLLARLAAREFPDFPVYSICELPFTTLAEVCRASSQCPAEVAFSYAGVNHLGWLYRISFQETDLVAPFRDRRKYSCFYPLMRDHGAVPLKYFALHLDPQQAVCRQRKAPSRAAQLATIRQRAFAAFESGVPQNIRQVLALRPTPWYSHAIGPLLAQFATGNASAMPFFLSTADASGHVSERAYKLADRCFYPLPAADPPEELRALNARYSTYEAQAAEAVHDPDPRRLARALAAHPWILRKNDSIGLAEIIWKGARESLFWAS